MKLEQNRRFKTGALHSLFYQVVFRGLHNNNNLSISVTDIERLFTIGIARLFCLGAIIEKLLAIKI